MEPRRWQQVRRLFESAIERPPAVRRSYLDQACAADAELRQEVEALLAAHSGAGAFLAEPAARLVPAGDGPSTEGPPPERTLGVYRLLEEVGRGGMGAVFRAERIDGEVPRQVAVKLLRPGLEGEEALKRFRLEGRVLSRLDHPNIARLFDSGTTAEGRPYLVMEYVVGAAIDRYCDEHRFSPADRLRLFCKVCRAVHFAHQNLIVHRDLKPSNLLVAAPGEPKLLDFGIAKLLDCEAWESPGPTTLAGSMPMTPEYASPEQVRRLPITTATDVYSLGAVLYELLTGLPAHRLQSRTPEEVFRVVCQLEPEKPSTARRRGRPPAREPRADTPAPSPTQARRGEPRPTAWRLAGDLDSIVLMALRKEPERRYGSAEELALDIERYLSHQPVRAHRGSLAYRAGKYLRRNRIALAASALLLGLALLASGLFAFHRQQALLERRSAAAIGEFLVAVFSSPDPSQARGETVTALDILDRSLAEIERRIEVRPATRADLLDAIGRVYQQLGQLEKAERPLRLALELRRGDPGTPPGAVAASLQHLGTLLSRRGDHTAAEPLLLESVELHRTRERGELPGFVASLVELGACLQQQARAAEAEPFLVEALALSGRWKDRLRHSNLADDPRSLEALAATSLAILRSQSGRYAETEELYRRTLAIYRRLYSSPHPDIATATSNLGRVLTRRGAYPEAEPLLREALEMDEKLFGRVHPTTYFPVNNLALLLTARGRYAEAEALSREAAEIARRTVGEEHPSFIASLGNHAVVLAWTHGAEDAEPQARRAVDLGRKRFGPHHPGLAAALRALAAVLQHRGAYREAGALLEEAAAIQRRAGGDRHPELGISLSELGQARGRHGDAAGAERALAEALEILGPALGERHDQVGLAHLRRSVLRREAGEPALAADLAATARDLFERQLGGEHPLTAEALAQQAASALDLGPTAAAEALARRVVDGPFPDLPGTRPIRARAELVLGRCLLREGRLAEAEPLLVSSFRTLDDRLGRRDRDTVRALEALVELYSAWKRPREADRFRSLLAPTAP